MSNAEQAFVYSLKQDSKIEPEGALIKGGEKTARIIEFPQDEEKESEENFEQRILQWSKKWIEEFYENRESPNGMSFGALEFDGALAEVCESDQSREGSNIFLVELLNFIEDKIKQEEKEEKVTDFIAGVSQYLFSYSPNIINQVSLENMFAIAVRASRIEEIQGYFGQTMNSELANEVRRSSEQELESMSGKILEGKTSELLDSVNFLQVLIAKTFAQQADDHNGVNKFLFVFDEIEKKQTPLVKYAVDLAKKRIKKEKENPTLGSLVYDGNKNAGRLDEQIDKEDQESNLALAKKIRPNIEIWGEEKLLPISNDAIGFFDHSNNLRKYAEISVSDLQAESDCSYSEIENLIKLVKQNPQSFAHTKKFLSLVENAKRRKIISEAEFEKALSDEDYFLQILLAKKESLDETLPGAYFERIEKITENERTNPFSKEISDEDILLLQQLHVPAMKKAIENDLGIKMAEIPLRSQFYLLQYISDKEGIQYGQLQQCLQKNQQVKGEIAYAFLIAAENSQYADAILEIANEYNEHDLREIFLKYREIAEGTRQMEALMQTQFKQEKEFSVSQIQLTARTVLQKANEVLLDFAEQIKNDEVLDQDKLEQKLASIKADQIFFTSVFKNFAKNNPEASFEDFKGLSLETISSPEVKKYSERFFEIANENNKNENPIMQEIVRKGLKKGLESEKTVFDVLLKDEDPIALQRFDDKGTYYYYGSVNVTRAFHGSAIFEQMKKESLDRRAKEKPIKAHCNSANFVSKQYIESSGFVATEMVLDGEIIKEGDKTIDKRLFTFAIERDDQKNGNYQYRQHVSTEQLKAMENQLREDLESGKESRKELVRTRKPFVISFEENQRPTFFKLAEKLTKDYGYVISRYFFDGKTGGKFFAGFEQKI